jgi:hypothetical protein
MAKKGQDAEVTLCSPPAMNGSVPQSARTNVRHQKSAERVFVGTLAVVVHPHTSSMSWECSMSTRLVNVRDSRVSIPTHVATKPVLSHPAINLSCLVPIRV